VGSGQDFQTAPIAVKWCETMEEREQCRGQHGPARVIALCSRTISAATPKTISHHNRDDDEVDIPGHAAGHLERKTWPM